MPVDSSARRTGRTALIVAAVVVGIAVVAGGVFVLFFLPTRSTITQVPTPSAASSGSAGSQGAAATGGSGTSGAVTPQATTTGPSTTAKLSAKPSPMANDVSHQATFITKNGVADGGDPTLTFDYVQWLTGSAATKAAKAHGDTVENDYYVVNDNPKLRTFPVAPSVVIVLHPGNGPQYSRTFTLDEFKSLMAAETATYAGRFYSWSPETTYYVTIKNGKVTRIDHQWVP